MVTTAWPLAWRIAAILLGGVVLLMAGVRLTRVADTLADRTGLGEAMAAAVLLGRRDVAAGPRDPVVAVVGWVIGTAGLSIADRTGLSGSLVGATFTAVVTSLPELVTVVTAVRIGAVTLAAGDIVGANTFDGPGGAPHRLRRRRDPRPLRDRHRLAVRPG